MSKNVRKWLILSAKIYLQAEIWISLPLHSIENQRKYISAVYQQNYKLHFQPFIETSGFGYFSGKINSVLDATYVIKMCFKKGAFVKTSRFSLKSKSKINNIYTKKEGKEIQNF